MATAQILLPAERITQAILSVLRSNTVAELEGMIHELRQDPANRNQEPGSIYLYSPKARTRLHDITLAITWHLREQQRAPK